MQSIELTEEHKIKLLEMCKVLFPEYDEYTFWNGDFIGMYHLIDNEESLEDNISIHWFEFCMRFLIERLSRKINNWEDMPPYVANVYGGAEGKWNLYTKFHFFYPKACWGGCSDGEYSMPVNPIDYLYHQFKKL